MREIKVEDAVGQVLSHDLTQIIPKQYKGPKFRKGHIIKEEDIPILKSMGKNNVYVLELKEGILHEDQAAERLYGLCKNENIKSSGEIKEGKVELLAEIDGLLKVDTERLLSLNLSNEAIIASRHSNTVVKAGEVLAGMRIIPLTIEEDKIQEIERIVGSEPLFRLLPFKLKTVAIVTTGTEVATGLVEDKFTPALKKKLEVFGMRLIFEKKVEDNQDKIVEALEQAKVSGADLILATGGMSVDPDDRTPASILKSGAKLISYGAPVLPGSMLLVGYYESGVPVLGLPGCVMYAKATVFDLILPRILAGEKLSKKDIAKLGNGGLCLQCKSCSYPICSFGKV